MAVGNRAARGRGAFGQSNHASLAPGSEKSTGSARWQVSWFRLHPEAEREFLEALAWYRDRSVVVASDFELAASKAVHAIEAAPQRWPSYFGEFRRYTLHRFPFNIVYQELLSEIV